MRGRKPKPTILKLVAGNPGKGALSLTEPIPEPGALVKPDWLDEIASEHWDWLAPRLTASKMARPIDSMAVAQYCATFSLWKKAHDFIAQNGSVRPIYKVIRKPDGSQEAKAVDAKEWPQAKQVRHLGLLLIKLASELGIMPASRTRVSTAEDGVARGTRNEAALRQRYFAG